MNANDGSKVVNMIVSGMLSYMVLGFFFSGMLIDIIKPRLLSMAVFFIISFAIGMGILLLITTLLTKRNKRKIGK